MSRIGTKEAIVEEMGNELPHWRKPLSMIEINQMAPTPEVRARPGRP
jgi:hypothetical protein